MKYDMQRLERGIYEIPEGCTCRKVIGENVIEIRDKRERRLSPEDKRCMNCVHFIEGKSLSTQWWHSMVCEARPKNPEKGLFYARTYRMGEGCELFKKKELEK